MTKEQKEHYARQLIELQKSFEQVKAEPLDLNLIYRHIGLLSQHMEELTLEIIGCDNE